MENKNDNGRGIFYGVIGVATLVVAMIGATFAYFSAEASTPNNAITATAANITLEMGDPVITGVKQNLIPVDETQDGFATGGYVGVSANTTTPQAKNCVDDDGNTFCSVYTFTIKNPSTTTAQKVYARMDVVTNTFTTNGADSKECKANDNAGTIYCQNSNFAFAIFKGTADDVDKNTSIGWNVDGTAVTSYYGPAAVAKISETEGGVVMYDPITLTSPTTKRVAVLEDTSTGKASTSGNVSGTGVLGLNGDMVVARTPVPTLTGSNVHSFRLGALDQTLKPNDGSATYTVVMWLHENEEDQQNDESGVFAAGITFSTSLGGSGVTAVLASSGQLGNS